MNGSDDNIIENTMTTRREEENFVDYDDAVMGDENDDEYDDDDDDRDDDVRPLTLNLGDLSGKASEEKRRGSWGTSLSTSKRKVKLLKDTVV